VYECALAAWKKGKAVPFHDFIMFFNNIDSDSITQPLPGCVWHRAYQQGFK
jgi:hypothetical protein